MTGRYPTRPVRSGYEHELRPRGVMFTNLHNLTNCKLQRCTLRDLVRGSRDHSSHDHDSATRLRRFRKCRVTNVQRTRAVSGCSSTMTGRRSQRAALAAKIDVHQQNAGSFGAVPRIKKVTDR